MITVKTILYQAACVATAALACSCSAIDEDMSDCGIDCRIDYNVCLHTNVTDEVNTVLATAEEQRVGRELKAALAGVFNSVAKDVDMLFYTSGTEVHSESHEINADRASFTVYLPQQDYMHLTTANMAAESTVAMAGTGSDRTLTMVQTEADTISSHSAALYSARQAMKVENSNRTFRVNMYMVNSAAALVVDTTGVAITDMRVFASGFNTEFQVADSVYSTTAQPVVRTNGVGVPDSKYMCSYAVVMPSAKQQRGNMVGQRGNTGGWKLHVYVTLASGKTTETILTVGDELKAAQLKIIKGRVGSQGEIVPDAQNVGASVTLDWKPGGIYEPEV